MEEANFGNDKIHSAWIQNRGLGQSNVYFPKYE